MAYQEELTKHRHRLPLYDLDPITENAWVAPNATVVGEVLILKYSSIWYNAVVRGDLNKVHILDFVSIGENSVVMTSSSLPTGMPASCKIGSNTVVENNCTIISADIAEDCYIGAHSTILEGAKIERGAHIAPYTVVPPGRLIPAD